jgi:hypothetical protein
MLRARPADGRQDQIVFIEEWHARLVAGRVRRIQREFGQESFARWIPLKLSRMNGFRRLARFAT